MSWMFLLWTIVGDSSFFMRRRRPCADYVSSQVFHIHVYPCSKASILVCWPRCRRMALGKVPIRKSRKDLGKEMLFIGPIAIWASRLDQPYWLQFTEVHASRLRDVEAIDADIQQRVRGLRQSELSPDNDSVIAFIEACLRWDPVSRISATGALDVFLGQEFTRSSREAAMIVSASLGEEQARQSSPPRLFASFESGASVASTSEYPSGAGATLDAAQAAEAAAQTAADDETCKCSGNCGSILHRQRAKGKERPFCKFTRAPDSDRCRECVCLLCHRPRSHTNAVTCVACWDENAKMLKKGYLNRHLVYFRRVVSRCVFLTRDYVSALSYKLPA